MALPEGQPCSQCPQQAKFLCPKCGQVANKSHFTDHITTHISASRATAASPARSAGYGATGRSAGSRLLWSLWERLWAEGGGWSSHERSPWASYCSRRGRLFCCNKTRYTASAGQAAPVLKKGKTCIHKWYSGTSNPLLSQNCPSNSGSRWKGVEWGLFCVIQIVLQITKQIYRGKPGKSNESV